MKAIAIAKRILIAIITTKVTALILKVQVT